MVLRESLPIKCVEAASCAVLTAGIDGLERVPLAFKTTVGKHTFRHIGGAPRPQGQLRVRRFGISRRKELMFRELAYPTMSAPRSFEGTRGEVSRVQGAPRLRVPRRALERAGGLAAPHGDGRLRQGLERRWRRPSTTSRAGGALATPGRGGRRADGRVGRRRWRRRARRGRGALRRRGGHAPPRKESLASARGEGRGQGQGQGQGAARQRRRRPRERR